MSTEPISPIAAAAPTGHAASARRDDADHNFESALADAQAQQPATPDAAQGATALHPGQEHGASSPDRPDSAEHEDKGHEAEVPAANLQAAEIAVPGRFLPVWDQAAPRAGNTLESASGATPASSAACSARSAISSAFRSAAWTASAAASNAGATMEPASRESALAAKSSLGLPFQAQPGAAAITEFTRQNESSAPQMTQVASDSAALRPDIPATMYTERAASREAALSPRVGEHGWSEALSNRVVVMAGKHEQAAELRLNPPELGPLKILLTISGDQASAQFISAHAPVRDAVEQALPRLQQMLSDNGITLGNTSVSGEAFSQQTGQDTGRSGHAFGTGDDAAGPIPVLPMRVLQGLVDTFA